MSKKDGMTRSFGSLAEFADQFGKDYLAATDPAALAVIKHNEEVEARTVRDGVTFVPAPVDEQHETDWTKIRKRRQAEADAVAHVQATAAKAMSRVNDAARKGRQSRIAG